jgi:hypothetical protein
MDGAKPVVSQRVVRAIDPATSVKDLKNNRVVALGAPGDVLKWLKGRKIPVITSVAGGKVDGDVVVVGPCRRIAAADRARAAALLEFVRNGGRIVILGQDAWDWKALIDFDLQDIDCSRAFLYSDARHLLLAGIDGEYLKRWNGLPGRIAGKAIQGPILDRASKLLWAEEMVMPVVIRIPAGKGEIVICLLEFGGRLMQGAKGHDPVAERMLLNLLQR